MIPPTNAFPLNTMIRKIAIPPTNALLSFLHILPVTYTLSAVDPVLGHRNVKLHALVFLTVSLCHCDMQRPPQAITTCPCTPLATGVTEEGDTEVGTTTKGASLTKRTWM